MSFQSFSKHVEERWEGKGMERKGKEWKGTHVRMEKKIPFVGLEPTPSAIRADVLIQLD